MNIYRYIIIKYLLSSMLYPYNPPITKEVTAHIQLNFGENGGVLVIPFERLDFMF